MKFKHIIISLLLLLTAVGPVRAESPLSERVVELGNQLVLSMYQDIMDAKKNYPELKTFGEQALFKNKNGIYALLYEYVDEETGDPYSFGITVNGIDSVNFKDKEGKFSYGFPKLKVKISGFSQKHPLRTQYDILPLIPKYGLRLAEYQQEFMPLRIFIEPVKESFAVEEAISFDVVLKNVSNRHMVVKSLGQESLYFLINNQTWGTNPLNGKPGGKDVVLRSGQEIRTRLRGDGFMEPKDINMTCVYGMAIDGVNPIGKANVVIQEQ